MELETCMSYLLQHTATALQRQLDHVLQTQFSIGMAQFKILMLLQQKPQLQQSKLAACLGQTEASISRQVKLLVDIGLVQVAADPHSRSIKLTTITPNGTLVAQQASVCLRQHIAPALAQLSPEQKQHLQESLLLLHAFCCSSGKSFACDHPFTV